MLLGRGPCAQLKGMGTKAHGPPDASYNPEQQVLPSCCDDHETGAQRLWDILRGHDAVK